MTASEKQLFHPRFRLSMNSVKNVILWVLGTPFSILITWFAYMLLVRKEFGPLSSVDVVFGTLFLVLGPFASFFFLFSPLLLYFVAANSCLEVSNHGLVFVFLGSREEMRVDQIEKAVVEIHPSRGERMHVYRVGGGRRTTSKRTFPEGYAAALERLKQWGKLQ